VLWLSTFVFALLSLPGCEDEMPSGPRGGIPEAAPPAPAALGQKAGAAPAKADPAAAGAAVKTRRSRAPTASEVLGLETDGKGKVATFFRAEPRDGPNPLFTGKSALPTGRHASLRVRSINVSPIERHWGSDLRSSTKSAGAFKAKLVLELGDEPEERDFLSDAEDAAQGGKAAAKTAAVSPAAATGGEHSLLMYRLDPKTGRLDTFKRKFPTKAAKDAAARFATMSGYSFKAPSAAAVSNARKKVRAANKASEAVAKKEGEKKVEKKDDCAFRATWYEGSGNNRTSQSRCFSSQSELDLYMTARKAARDAAIKKPEKKPEKKAGDDSLAPIDLE
jgi:hypothetical protein